MKRLPLSKDVTALMTETNRQFTASEMATITYHLGNSMVEKHHLLNEISEKTNDSVLNQQIRERISYEQRALSLFQSGGSGLVYSLFCKNDGAWCSHGYYGTFHAAEMQAKDRTACRIEKNRMFGENDHPAISVRMNPRVWNEPENQDVEIAFTSQPLSEAEFDASGNILFFHSNEMPAEETDRVEDWGAERFEEKYIDAPNPFNCGDVVCLIGDESAWGIVETSKAEWEAYKQEIAVRSLPVDFSDASITVSFLNAEGGFTHSHVCPLFLEKREASTDTPCGLLLNTASDLLKGKGTLEAFSGALKQLVRNCPLKDGDKQ